MRFLDEFEIIRDGTMNDDDSFVECNIENFKSFIIPNNLYTAINVTVYAPYTPTIIIISEMSSNVFNSI